MKHWKVRSTSCFVEETSEKDRLLWLFYFNDQILSLLIKVFFDSVVVLVSIIHKESLICWERFTSQLFHFQNKLDLDLIKNQNNLAFSNIISFYEICN